AGRPPESTADNPQTAAHAASAERLTVPFRLTTSKRRASRSYRRASRSYTATSYAGLLSLDGNVLRLEIEAREIEHSPTGSRERMTLQEKAIPLSDLQSVQFLGAWFMTRVVIQALRFSVVAGLPGSRRGLLTLHIAQRDREVAERFVTMVRRKLRGDVSAGAGPDLEMLRLQLTRPAGRLFVTALTALLSLAVIFAIGRAGPRPAISDPALALGMAAVFLATAVLLIGAGSIRRFAAYDWCICAAVLAMLPWSLAFPLGFFVGLRTLRVLRR